MGYICPKEGGAQTVSGGEVPGSWSADPLSATGLERSRTPEGRSQVCPREGGTTGLQQSHGKTRQSLSPWGHKADSWFYCVLPQSTRHQSHAGPSPAARGSLSPDVQEGQALSSRHVQRWGGAACREGTPRALGETHQSSNPSHGPWESHSTALTCMSHL